MNDKKNRVCPIEKAGLLDNVYRRWFQNPRKILKLYIKEGMVVLDIGCGPGFFSVEMAKMAGESGWVIAADLQEGMLEKLRSKIKGTELERRIVLHKSQADKIGVTEKADFALAFYLVHEIPDRKIFFEEVKSLLKPGARLLVVEPPFHVSRAEFDKTIGYAAAAGLIPEPGPKVFLGKTVILKNG